MPTHAHASLSGAISLGSSLWADPLAMTTMTLLIAGLPVLIVLARGLTRLPRLSTERISRPAIVNARPTLGQLCRDDHATATIEFTLVFPILLFLIMLLTQSTLLMGGSLVCTHAAFAAARSAVVVIPIHDPGRGEPANVIQGQADSYKTQRIRQAAVMAMLPVAGRMPEPASPSPRVRQLVDGLAHYHRAHGQEPPLWIDRLIASRLHYADAHTGVTILRPRVIQGSLSLEPVETLAQFGPRDPITVQVHHKLNLAVPYVGLLFADGRHPPEMGGSLYTRLTRQCTLTNEGVVNQLPPTPTLRRIP